MEKVYVLKKFIGGDDSIVGLFKTYVDAYNTAIDHITIDKYNRWLYDYTITKESVCSYAEKNYDCYNGFSVYNSDLKCWQHTFPIENTNVKESTDSCRIAEWRRECPQFVSNSSMAEINDAMFIHNVTTLTEMNGYKEFCERTLKAYNETFRSQHTTNTNNKCEYIYIVSNYLTTPNGVFGCFSDYVTAYNAVIDMLWEDSLITMLGYAIRKVKINELSNGRGEEVVSLYDKQFNEWSHHFAQKYTELSYQLKMKDWCVDDNPTVVNTVSEQQLLEEKIGYKEFCNRTKYTDNI